jgi:hypothetical protein
MVAVTVCLPEALRHAPPVITRLEEIVSGVQGCVYVSVIDALDATPYSPLGFIMSSGSDYSPSLRSS